MGSVAADAGCIEGELVVFVGRFADHFADVEVLRHGKFDVAGVRVACLGVAARAGTARESNEKGGEWRV